MLNLRRNATPGRSDALRNLFAQGRSLDAPLTEEALTARPAPAVDADPFRGREDLRRALEVATDGLMISARAVARELSDEDIEPLLSDAKMARAFVQALLTTRQMMERKIPAHYTSYAICRGCGPVPIYEGSPERVTSCPWCRVKAKGILPPQPSLATIRRVNQARAMLGASDEGIESSAGSAPAPGMAAGDTDLDSANNVACAGCYWYQPNRLEPVAGLGRCKVYAPDREDHELPSWPLVTRRCRSFLDLGPHEKSPDPLAAFEQTGLIPGSKQTVLAFPADLALLRRALRWVPRKEWPAFLDECSARFRHALENARQDALGTARRALREPLDQLLAKHEAES